MPSSHVTSDHNGDTKDIMQPQKQDLPILPKWCIHKLPILQPLKCVSICSKWSNLCNLLLVCQGSHPTPVWYLDHSYQFHFRLASKMKYFEVLEFSAKLFRATFPEKKIYKISYKYLNLKIIYKWIRSASYKIEMVKTIVFDC